MTTFLWCRMADSDLGVLVNTAQISMITPMQDHGLPKGALVYVEGAKIPVKESVSRIAETLMDLQDCAVADARKQGRDPVLIEAGANGTAG